ncbi:hypothetical protein COB55_01005 [Candidatus Wolfebacteria bacterium]|nr:MAG: hypothetical protein COB55_01005 [Candidatus Wolfebacteria bacterium]
MSGTEIKKLANEIKPSENLAEADNASARVRTDHAIGAAKDYIRNGIYPMPKIEKDKLQGIKSKK